MADRVLHVGALYRHFKGGLYRVLSVAYHTETEEKLVICQAEYGDRLTWACPYDVFMSEVEHEKCDDVTQRYRMEEISA